MNPRLEIDLAKIKHNTQFINQICVEYGCQLVGLTKGCGGLPQIATAMIRGGAHWIGDSRRQHIQRLSSVISKDALQFIRAPMISEANEIVSMVDISLNTELETLAALGRAAVGQGKVHQVILLLETGDQRDGILWHKLADVVTQATTIEGIEIIGISGLIACRKLVFAKPSQIHLLLQGAKLVESIIKKKLRVISAGGSTVLGLMLDKRCPTGITQLRAGEGILLGTNSVNGNKLSSMLHSDAFHLVAEVISIKPIEPNMYGFGEAVIAIGFHDTRVEGLMAERADCEIVDNVSDHTIVSYDTRNPLRVGQELRFQIKKYETLARASISPLVEKVFI